MKTDRVSVLPNFLVIGAQRCATSWLYFCFRNHPEVYVPFVKEVKFFNRHYEKGLEWYGRYFKAWKGQKAVGEISPSYLYVDGTAERIAKDLPQVRLIVCLRDPVERAYSQYLKHVRAGTVHTDFETAWKSDPQYAARGYYHAQLERYFRHFPKERVLIMIYEDIEKDPVAFLRQIWDFLGVSSLVSEAVFKKIPSESLAGGAYSAVTRASSFLRQRMGLGSAIDWIKKSPVQPWVDGWLYPKRDGKKKTLLLALPTLDPLLRERLASVFRSDNQKLETLLNRRLNWSGIRI